MYVSTGSPNWKKRSANNSQNTLANVAALKPSLSPI